MAAQPSLPSEFHALGQDLKSFIETRYEMLRAELSTGIVGLRAAAVLFAAAAVFALVGILLLGFCASFALGLAFGAFQNQVGLIWGFLVIGGASLMLAGIIARVAQARLRTVNLKPKRTLSVLQRDEETLKQAGESHGHQSQIRRTA